MRDFDFLNFDLSPSAIENIQNTVQRRLSKRQLTLDVHLSELAKKAFVIQTIIERLLSAVSAASAVFISANVRRIININYLDVCISELSLTLLIQDSRRSTEYYNSSSTDRFRIVS